MMDGYYYIKSIDYIFINSVGSHRHRGVAIIVTGNLERTISWFWAHNDRMVQFKIKARLFDIARLQTYAPKTNYADEQLEEYYQDLQ